MRTPWTEFVFSSGMQAVAVALLIWVRLLYPTVVTPPEHTFRSIQLVPTPVPVNHQPQPVVNLPKPVLVAELDPPSNALRLPTPQPRPPVKTEDDPAPTVTITPKKLDPMPINSAPVIPKQAVKTNVFSTGSSATPTIARAPSQVQTGGFGDPNGIAAQANQGKAVNIAAVGSFDLPAGPGYGNGTGGAKRYSGRSRKFGIWQRHSHSGEPASHIGNRSAARRLWRRGCSRRAYCSLCTSGRGRSSGRACGNTFETHAHLYSGSPASSH